MSAERVGRITGLCLICAMTVGCSTATSSATVSHEALLKEYQAITDRATELVRAGNVRDPSVGQELKQLAERAMDVTHKKLSVQQLPTLEQSQRYQALATRFREVLNVASGMFNAAPEVDCPTCPKHR